MLSFTKIRGEMFSRGIFPLAVLLLVVFLVPHAAIADWLDELVENAEQGGGTVIIENHSSVSTGGQVAGSGQAVVTDGDVSSSSHVETYINAGSNGGSAQVKVETSKNGVTETKEYSQEVGKGEPVHINVSAKATNAEEAKVEVRGWDAEKKETVALEPATTSTTETKTSARIVIQERLESALKSVPGFFKKVFGFLWGW